MQLVSNWRAVLLRAYSIWCQVLMAVIAVAIQTVPFMSDIIPVWVIVLVLVAGVYARLVKQPGLHDGEE